jgi:hypothetical protein
MEANPVVLLSDTGGTAARSCPDRKAAVSASTRYQAPVRFRK